MCSVSLAGELNICADQLGSGYTSVPDFTINPSKVSVSFVPPSISSDPLPLRLLTNGEPEPDIDENRASAILAEDELEIEVDLGHGPEETKVWTCDFSHVSVLRHTGETR